MMNTKTGIKDRLCDSLENDLDPWLLQYGFSRRKGSLIYERELAEAFQKIDIHFETHPADRPDSVAAVYPWLDVRVDAVNTLVLEMIGDDLSLLPGLPGGTLRQPIEFTSAKAMNARWFIFHTESISAIVSQMKAFMQRWTLSFLESYTNPKGICDAYDRDDARVINDLAQKLRVAAAMVLCGRSVDAIGVMERWFGKPGPRKRYKRVFDYLTAQ